MKRMWLIPLFWVVLSSVTVFFIFVQKFRQENRLSHGIRCLYDSPEDFVGFDNVSGNPDGCFIVPNIVHFVRFGKPEFSFEEAVCVISVAKNQKPDAIYFHMNVPRFQGKYWDKTCYKGNYIMKILIKYGGIYLGNQTYVVQPLDEFRRFELTVGWESHGNVSNQVIVANKHARFLKKWLAIHDDDYDHYEEVLSKHPELVHRVKRRLAEHEVTDMLYVEDNEDTLMDHYAINLSPEATHPVVLNEDNIGAYPCNFQHLVDYVYPFKIGAKISRK